MIAPPPAAPANCVIRMLPDTESGDVACDSATIVNGGATRWLLRHKAHGRRGLHIGLRVPSCDADASWMPIESMSKVVSPRITESVNVTNSWSRSELSAENAE